MKIDTLFPIGKDEKSKALYEKVCEVLETLCGDKSKDIRLRHYAQTIMIAFKEYEESGFDAAMSKMDDYLKSIRPDFVDNSEHGFPVKIETDPRWPLICQNDCRFERKCANAASAGDYRSESGLTPDFEKNEDGSISCYGCGDLSDGMRLFTENGKPTTDYEMYSEDRWNY